MDKLGELTSDTHVRIGDGKYTVVHNNGVGLRALRYGKPWRDLVGDGLVLAMAQEIENLSIRLESELVKPTPFSIVPGLSQDPVYKMALDSASRGFQYLAYCQEMNAMFTAYPDVPLTRIGAEAYALLCYLFNAEVDHNANTM